MDSGMQQQSAEKLFGGVTRDLLERIEIPLLLSH